MKGMFFQFNNSDASSTIYRLKNIFRNFFIKKYSEKLFANQISELLLFAV